MTERASATRRSRNSGMAPGGGARHRPYSTARARAIGRGLGKGVARDRLQDRRGAVGAHEDGQDGLLAGRPRAFDDRRGDGVASVTRGGMKIVRRLSTFVVGEQRAASVRS